MTASAQSLFAAAPKTTLGVPTAISADLLAPPSRVAVHTTLALCAAVLAFIAWAAFANLEEVAQARGRIIPASKLQIVQNLEGGIVREISIHEGQEVAEGQIILSIDPTLSGASLGEVREKIGGLTALIARLEAEVEGKELAFPAEVAQASPGLVASQDNLYRSRQQEFNAGITTLELEARQREQEILEIGSKIATLMESLRIVGEDMSLARGLVQSRAISRAEVLQIEGRYNDTRGNLEAAQLALPRLQSARDGALSKRTEKASAFKSDALAKLTQARTDLAALKENAWSGADKVARTKVRSPVAGIVKTINVTTVGQVVQPGSNLVEIVPLNDTLLVEAQVRPQDIAFLRPGLEAVVKLTAYDFAIYGGLKARVEQIGIDSVTPEKGEPYYPVRVRTDRRSLAYKGEQLPIIPGMVAEVDVLTGRKTVLQYLTRTFLRVRMQAMRER